MEDIEVIYKLEKLLGVKSEEISLEDWKESRDRKSEICYTMIEGELRKLPLT